jgi:hypothetical protein
MGIETNNYCAGEDQRQFNRPTEISWESAVEDSYEIVKNQQRRK